MIRLLVRLAVNALALWVAIRLVPGLHYEGGGTSLFFIALILFVRAYLFTGGKAQGRKKFRI